MSYKLGDLSAFWALLLPNPSSFLSFPFSCAIKPRVSYTMPLSKKQKTSVESSAPTQEKEPESATLHKSDKDKEGRDVRISRL
jgi:hypothetical protein